MLGIQMLNRGRCHVEIFSNMICLCWEPTKKLSTAVLAQCVNRYKHKCSVYCTILYATRILMIPSWFLNWSACFKENYSTPIKANKWLIENKCVQWSNGKTIASLHCNSIFFKLLNRPLCVSPLFLCMLGWARLCLGLNHCVFNAFQMTNDCFRFTSLCSPDIKEGWCGDDWAGGRGFVLQGGRAKRKSPCGFSLFWMLAEKHMWKSTRLLFAEHCRHKLSLQ